MKTKGEIIEGTQIYKGARNGARKILRRGHYVIELWSLFPFLAPLTVTGDVTARLFRLDWIRTFFKKMSVGDNNK